MDVKNVTHDEPTEVMQLDGNIDVMSALKKVEETKKGIEYVIIDTPFG